MFENIIGQDGVVDELKQNIQIGRLPASMLFYGPPLSAKLTTALELARVLMCERAAGDWSCNCSACRQNRLLENPYLLLLGWKNFQDEILASADVLRRSDAQAPRFLFARAVRKLVKRFDGVLWEGVENKIASDVSLLQELEESLEPLLPAGESLSPQALEKALNRTTELSARLIKKSATDGIPVHQVRKASYWAHTTSGASQKVVILENADRMYQASANALLKTLEEPPANTYFILLTSHRDQIMPTLRSRLRHFHFRQRSSRIQEDIIRRIFRDTSGTYESLNAYFLAWGVNTDLVSQAGECFIKAIQNETPGEFFAEDNPFAKELENPRFFNAFLDATATTLRKSFLQTVETEGADIGAMCRYEVWNRTLDKQRRRTDAYNINPVLLLHSLYREVVVEA
jgi:DNA polymerase III subunit gamma/tau